MTNAWSRGPQQHITSDRLVHAEERTDRVLAAARLTGDHVWIATVAYLVTPPLEDGAILDVDNLMFRPAVGCYVCEEPWSPYLNRRRCKGDPV